VDEVLEKLKLMEEHIITARYPVEDEKGTFVTPSEYYDKPKAEKLLQNARKVLEKIEAIINTISEKEN